MAVNGGSCTPEEGSYEVISAIGKNAGSTIKFNLGIGVIQIENFRTDFPGMTTDSDKYLPSSAFSYNSETETLTMDLKEMGKASFKDYADFNNPETMNWVNVLCTYPVEYAEELL